MKLTHLISEDDMADLGLKGHGSELDIDMDPNAEKFKQPQMMVQLRKVADYPEGGTVKTDDGDEIKVSNREARMITAISPIAKLGPVFGIHPKMARDPDADEAIIAKLQTTDGINKVLGLIRK